MNNLIRQLFGGERGPASPAPEAKVVPLNFSNIVSTSQQEEPMDPEVFRALLERSSAIQPIEAQRGSAKGIRDLGRDISQMPVNVDLTPVAGFLKAVYGKDVGYKAPESGESRAAILAKLQEMSAGVENSAATNTLAAIKAQLVNKNKIESKSGTAEKIAPQPKIGMYEDKPTKGEDAFDVEFAKKAADYHALGGYGTIQKNLDKLNAAKAKLQEPGELNSYKRGYLPEGLQSFASPDLYSVGQNVKDAIGASLKQLRGSQFTEKEADKVERRTFDSRVSDQENIERIDATIKQLETEAKALDESYKYFRSNKGTLRGSPSASEREGTRENKSPQEGSTKIYNGETWIVKDGRWIKAK